MNTNYKTPQAQFSSPYPRQRGIFSAKGAGRGSRAESPTYISTGQRPVERNARPITALKGRNRNVARIPSISHLTSHI